MVFPHCREALLYEQERLARKEAGSLFCERVMSCAGLVARNVDWRSAGELMAVHCWMTRIHWPNGGLGTHVVSPRIR